MIIRSQDKKTLTNFQQVTDVFVLKNNGVFEVRVYYPFSLNDELCIGKYSTEEKAIKVLDMICDSCRNTAFIDEQAVVFLMPQDSEV